MGNGADKPKSGGDKTGKPADNTSQNIVQRAQQRLVEFVQSVTPKKPADKPASPPKAQDAPKPAPKPAAKPKPATDNTRTRQEQPKLPSRPGSINNAVDNSARNKPKPKDAVPPAAKTKEVAPPAAKTKEVAPPAAKTKEVAPPAAKTKEVAPPAAKTKEVAAPAAKTKEVAAPAAAGKQNAGRDNGTPKPEKPTIVNRITDAVTYIPKLIAGKPEQKEAKPNSKTEAKEPPGLMERVKQKTYDMAVSVENHTIIPGYENKGILTGRRLKPADKMSPNERAEKNVKNVVDFRNMTATNYDNKGRVHEVASLPKSLKTTVHYDQKGNADQFRIEHVGSKSVVAAFKNDANSKVNVNQRDGTLSVVSQHRDNNGQKGKQVDVFHPEGRVSQVRYNADNQRQDKTNYEFNDRGRLNATDRMYYVYSDQQGKGPVYGIHLDRRSNELNNEQNKGKSANDVLLQNRPAPKNISELTNSEITSKYVFRNAQSVEHQKFDQKATFTRDRQSGDTTVTRTQANGDKEVARFNEKGEVLSLARTHDGKVEEFKVDKGKLVAVRDGNTTDKTDPKALNSAKELSTIFNVRDQQAELALAYGPDKNADLNRLTDEVAFTDWAKNKGKEVTVTIPQGDGQFVSYTANNGEVRDENKKLVGYLNNSGQLILLEGKEPVINGKPFEDGTTLSHLPGARIIDWNKPEDVQKAIEEGARKNMSGMFQMPGDQDPKNARLVIDNYVYDLGTHRMLGHYDSTGKFVFALNDKNSANGPSSLDKEYEGYVFQGARKGNPVVFEVNSAMTGGEYTVMENGKPVKRQVELGMVLDQNGRQLAQTVGLPQKDPETGLLTGLAIRKPSPDGKSMVVENVALAPGTYMELTGMPDRTGSRHVIKAIGTDKTAADGTPLLVDVDAENARLKQMIADKQKALSEMPDPSTMRRSYGGMDDFGVPGQYIDQVKEDRRKLQEEIGQYQALQDRLNKVGQNSTVADNTAVSNDLRALDKVKALVTPADPNEKKENKQEPTKLELPSMVAKDQTGKEYNRTASGALRYGNNNYEIRNNRLLLDGKDVGEYRANHTFVINGREVDPRTSTTCYVKFKYDDDPNGPEVKLMSLGRNTVAADGTPLPGGFVDVKQLDRQMLVNLQSVQQAQSDYLGSKTVITDGLDWTVNGVNTANQFYTGKDLENTTGMRYLEWVSPERAFRTGKNLDEQEKSVVYHRQALATQTEKAFDMAFDGRLNQNQSEQLKNGVQNIMRNSNLTAQDSTVLSETGKGMNQIYHEGVMVAGQMMIPGLGSVALANLGRAAKLVDTTNKASRLINVMRATRAPAVLANLADKTSKAHRVTNVVTALGAGGLMRVGLDNHDGSGSATTKKFMQGSLEVGMNVVGGQVLNKYKDMVRLNTEAKVLSQFEHGREILTNAQKGSRLLTPLAELGAKSKVADAAIKTSVVLGDNVVQASGNMMAQYLGDTSTTAGHNKKLSDYMNAQNIAFVTMFGVSAHGVGTGFTAIKEMSGHADAARNLKNMINSADNPEAARHLFRTSTVAGGEVMEVGGSLVVTKGNSQEVLKSLTEMNAKNGNLMKESFELYVKQFPEQAMQAFTQGGMHSFYSDINEQYKAARERYGESLTFSDFQKKYWNSTQSFSTMTEQGAFAALNSSIGSAVTSPIHAREARHTPAMPASTHGSDAPAAGTHTGSAQTHDAPVSSTPSVPRDLGKPSMPAESRPDLTPKDLGKPSMPAEPRKGLVPKDLGKPAMPAEPRKGLTPKTNSEKPVVPPRGKKQPASKAEPQADTNAPPVTAESKKTARLEADESSNVSDTASKELGRPTAPAEPQPGLVPKDLGKPSMPAEPRPDLVPKASDKPQMGTERPDLVPKANSEKPALPPRDKKQLASEAEPQVDTNAPPVVSEGKETTRLEADAPVASNEQSRDIGGIRQNKADEITHYASKDIAIYKGENGETRLRDRQSGTEYTVNTKIEKMPGGDTIITDDAVRIRQYSRPNASGKEAAYSEVHPNLPGKGSYEQDASGRITKLVAEDGRTWKIGTRDDGTVHTIATTTADGHKIQMKHDAASGKWRTIEEGKAPYETTIEKPLDFIKSKFSWISSRNESMGMDSAGFVSIREYGKNGIEFRATKPDPLRHIIEHANYRKVDESRLTTDKILANAYVEKGNDGKINAITDVRGNKLEISPDLIKASNGSTWKRDSGDSWIMTDSKGVSRKVTHLEVASDGRLYYRDGNNNVTHRLDGSTQVVDHEGRASLKNANRDYEAAKIYEAARKHFGDSGELAQFHNHLNGFLKRATQEGMSPAEQGRFLYHVERMLVSDAKEPTTPQIRKQLAMELMFKAANPDRVSQGKNETCPMASNEADLAENQPSLIAKVVSEVSLTGSYRTLAALPGAPEGTPGVLVPFKLPHETGLISPNLESHQSVHDQQGNYVGVGYNQNIRDFSGEIFQKTMINTRFLSDSVYMKDSPAYPPGTLHYTGNHLIHLRTGQPLLRDGNLERVVHFYSRDIDRTHNLMFGQNMDRVVMGHGALRSERYWGVPNNHDIKAGRVVESPGDLLEVMVGMRKHNERKLDAIKRSDNDENEMPGRMLLQINIQHEPFNGEIGFATIVGAGGNHEVSIPLHRLKAGDRINDIAELNTDIKAGRNSTDPEIIERGKKAQQQLDEIIDTTMVPVDGQWDKNSDHVVRKLISLRDLHMATLLPGSPEHISALKERIAKSPDDVSSEIDLARMRYKNRVEFNDQDPDMSCGGPEYRNTLVEAKNKAEQLLAEYGSTAGTKSEQLMLAKNKAEALLNTYDQANPPVQNPANVPPTASVKPEASSLVAADTTGQGRNRDISNTTDAAKPEFKGFEMLRDGEAPLPNGIKVGNEFLLRKDDGSWSIRNSQTGKETSFTGKVEYMNDRRIIRIENETTVRMLDGNGQQRIAFKENPNLSLVRQRDGAISSMTLSDKSTITFEHGPDGKLKTLAVDSRDPQKTVTLKFNEGKGQWEVVRGDKSHRGFDILLSVRDDIKANSSLMESRMKGEAGKNSAQAIWETDSNGFVRVYANDAAAGSLKVEGPFIPQPAVEHAAHLADLHQNVVMRRSLDGSVSYLKDLRGVEYHAENGLLKSSRGETFAIDADGKGTVFNGTETFKVSDFKVAADGTISYKNIKDDTTVSHRFDGSIETVDYDGRSRIRFADLEVETAKLEAKIESTFANKDALALKGYLDIFKARAMGIDEEGSTVNAAEQARFLYEVNRLLDESVPGKSDMEARRWLAEDLIFHAAMPNRIDQGWHSTCAFSSDSSALVAQRPSEFARLVSEVALAGDFKTYAGNMEPYTLPGQPEGVRINDEARQARYAGDGDAGDQYRTVGSLDKSRTLASSVYDTVLVNTRLAQHRFVTDEGQVFPPRSVFYDGQHFYDTRQNPPVLIKDSHGNPIDNPQVYDHMVADARRYVFGHDIKVVSDKEISKNRPELINGVKPDAAEDLLIALVDERERCQNAREENRARSADDDGYTPEAFRLKTFINGENEPFFTEIRAGVSVGESGHAVNIVGFRPPINKTELEHLYKKRLEASTDEERLAAQVAIDEVLDNTRVMVSNQWGRKREHVFDAIPLRELRNAMRSADSQETAQYLMKRVARDPDDIDAQVDMARLEHYRHQRSESFVDEAGEPVDPSASLSGRRIDRVGYLNDDQYKERLVWLRGDAIKTLAEHGNALDAKGKQLARALKKVDYLLAQSKVDVAALSKEQAIALPPHIMKQLMAQQNMARQEESGDMPGNLVNTYDGQQHQGSFEPVNPANESGEAGNAQGKSFQQQSMENWQFQRDVNGRQGAQSGSPVSWDPYSQVRGGRRDGRISSSNPDAVNPSERSATSVPDMSNMSPQMRKAFEQQLKQQREADGQFDEAPGNLVNIRDGEQHGDVQNAVQAQDVSLQDNNSSGRRSYREELLQRWQTQLDVEGRARQGAQSGSPVSWDPYSHVRDGRRDGRISSSNPDAARPAGERPAPSMPDLSSVPFHLRHVYEQQFKQKQEADLNKASLDKAGLNETVPADAGAGQPGAHERDVNRKPESGEHEGDSELELNVHNILRNVEESDDEAVHLDIRDSDYTGFGDLRDIKPDAHQDKQASHFENNDQSADVDPRVAQRNKWLELVEQRRVQQGADPVKFVNNLFLRGSGDTLHSKDAVFPAGKVKPEAPKPSPVFRDAGSDPHLNPLDRASVKNTDGSVHIEDLAGGSRVVSPDGKVVSTRTTEGKEYRYNYDADGNLKSLSTSADGKNWVEQESKVTHADGSVTEQKVLSDGSLRTETIKDGQLLERVDQRLDGVAEKTDHLGWKTLENVDTDKERARLIAAIDANVNDNGMQNRLRASMEILEERAHFGKSNQGDLGKTYHLLSRMMDGAPEPPALPKDLRLRVVSDFLALASTPEFVNQGRNPLCNVAALEAKMYARDPASAARILHDATTQGEIVTSSGQRISLVHPADNFGSPDNKSTLVFQPDQESHKPMLLNKEGGAPLRGGEQNSGNIIGIPRELGGWHPSARTLSSQIFQNLAVNARWASARRNPLGGEVELGSLRWTGKGLVIHDQTGTRTISDITGGAWMDPHLAEVDLPFIYNELSGQTEPIICNASKARRDLGNQVQIMEKGGVAAERNPFVTSEEHLLKFLEQTKADSDRDGKPLYIPLVVNTNAEPFYRDSGDGHLGQAGSWHVVNITGYEVVPVKTKEGTKYEVMVSVDNQWDKSAEHGAGNRIELSKLYRATLPHGELESVEHVRLLQQAADEKPNDLSLRLELVRAQYGLHDAAQNPRDIIAGFSPGADKIDAARSLSIKPDQYKKELNKLVTDVEKQLNPKNKQQLSASERADLEYIRGTAKALLANHQEDSGILSNYLYAKQNNLEDLAVDAAPEAAPGSHPIEVGAADRDIAKPGSAAPEEPRVTPENSPARDKEARDRLIPSIDENGDPVITNPDGSKVVHELSGVEKQYDKSGVLQSAKDTRGIEYRYSYDAEGKFSKVTFTEDGKTWKAHLAERIREDGNLQKTKVLPDGSLQIDVLKGEQLLLSNTYRLDGHSESIAPGRFSIITESNGVTRKFNNEGTLLEAKHANGNLFKFGYDGDGLKVIHHSTDGKSWESMPAVHTDAEGNVQRVTVLRDGTIQSELTRKNGEVLRGTVKADGTTDLVTVNPARPERSIDRVGPNELPPEWKIVTKGTVETDEHGFKIIREPSGAERKFDHDGRVVEAIDAKGGRYTYEYNNLDRMVKVKWTEAGAAQEQQRSDKANTVDGSVQYTKILLDGSMVTEVHKDGQLSLIETRSLDGSISHILVSRDENGIEKRTNTKSQLLEAKMGSASPFKYSYDKEGNLSEVRWSPDGKNWVTQSAEFTDGKGNIHHINILSDGSLQTTIRHAGGNESVEIRRLDGSLEKPLPEGGRSIIEPSGIQKTFNRNNQLVEAADINGRSYKFTHNNRGELETIATSVNGKDWTSRPAVTVLGDRTVRTKLAVDGSLISEVHDKGNLVLTSTRRLDGSCEERDAKGWPTLKDVDIKREYENMSRLLDHKVTNEEFRDRIKESLHQLLEKTLTGEVNALEAARVCNWMSRLIDAPEGGKTRPLAERIRVTSDVLAMVNFPHFANQGPNPTCNVTTVESLLYRKEPGRVAQLLHDAMLTGYGVDRQGNKIELFRDDDRDGLKPDDSTKKVVYLNEKKEWAASKDANLGYWGSSSDRSLASQYFQKLAVNDVWNQAVQTREGTAVTAGAIRYDGRGLVLTNADGTISPLLDSSGKISGAPSLYGNDIQQIYINLSSGVETPVLVSHSLVGTGGDINFHRSKFPSGLPENEDHNISSIKQLESLLDNRIQQAKERGEPFGLIAHVHCEHEPIYRDTGNGKEGGSSGWHVVNILGTKTVVSLDALGNHIETKHVIFSNQWGKAKQHIEHSVPLEDFYRMTLPMNKIDKPQLLELLQNKLAANPDDYSARLELIRAQRYVEKGIDDKLASSTIKQVERDRLAKQREEYIPKPVHEELNDLLHQLEIERQATVEASQFGVEPPTKHSLDDYDYYIGQTKALLKKVEEAQNPPPVAESTVTTAPGSAALPESALAEGPRPAAKDIELVDAMPKAATPVEPAIADALAFNLPVSNLKPEVVNAQEKANLPYPGSEVKLHPDGNGKVDVVTDMSGVKRQAVYSTEGKLKEIKVVNTDGSETALPALEVNGQQVIRRALHEDGSLETVTERAGRVIETRLQGLDGSVEITDRAGYKTVENVDFDRAAARLNNLIDATVSNDNLALRVKNSLDILNEKAHFGELNKEQAAKTYFWLAKTLEAGPSAYLPKEMRERLVSDALVLSTFPASINQGAHPLCNVANVQVRLAMREPATAAMLLCEAASKGYVMNKNGSKIPLDLAGEMLSVRPGREESSNRGLDPEGRVKREEGGWDGERRDYASQILQNIFANSYWESRSVDPNGRPIPDNIKVRYDGEKLVFVRDGRVAPVLDSEGKKIYSPNISPAEIQNIYDDFSTEPRQSFVLAHGSLKSGQSLQKTARLYHGEDAVNPAVSSSADLNNALTRMMADSQKEGRPFAATLVVDAGHEPFAVDSGAGRAGGSERLHVVTVVGMETVPGPDGTSRTYALVDNQWGKSKDHVYTKRIPVEDLYAAMLPVDKVNSTESLDYLGSKLQAFEKNGDTSSVDYLRTKLEHLRVQDTYQVALERELLKGSNSEYSPEQIDSLKKKYCFSEEERAEQLKAIGEKITLLDADLANRKTALPEGKEESSFEEQIGHLKEQLNAQAKWSLEQSVKSKPAAMELVGDPKSSLLERIADVNGQEFAKRLEASKQITESLMEAIAASKAGSVGPQSRLNTTWDKLSTYAEHHLIERDGQLPLPFEGRQLENIVNLSGREILRLASKPNRIKEEEALLSKLHQHTEQQLDQISYRLSEDIQKLQDGHLLSAQEKLLSQFNCKLAEKYVASLDVLEKHNALTEAEREYRDDLKQHLEDLKQAENDSFAVLTNGSRHPREKVIEAIQQMDQLSLKWWGQRQVPAPEHFKQYTQALEIIDQARKDRDGTSGNHARLQQAVKFVADHEAKYSGEPVLSELDSFMTSSQLIRERIKELNTMEQRSGQLAESDRKQLEILQASAQRAVEAQMGRALPWMMADSIGNGRQHVLPEVFTRSMRDGAEFENSVQRIIGKVFELDTLKLSGGASGDANDPYYQPHNWSVGRLPDKTAVDHAKGDLILINRATGDYFLLDATLKTNEHHPGAANLHKELVTLGDRVALSDNKECSAPERLPFMFASTQNALDRWTDGNVQMAAATHVPNLLKDIIEKQKPFNILDDGLPSTNPYASLDQQTKELAAFMDALYSKGYHGWANEVGGGLGYLNALGSYLSTRKNMLGRTP